MGIEALDARVLAVPVPGLLALDSRASTLTQA